MKYLIRSVKFFFHFIVLMVFIILALMLIGAVEGNINDIFEDGYNSLWKIAVFFALIAAVYPKVAFITRKIDVEADWDQVKSSVTKNLEQRRYAVESDEGDKVTFRLTRLADRISKKGEDMITLSRTAEGYMLEGLRATVISCVFNIEDQFFRMPEDEE